jgi:hypothetical protein
MTTFDDMEGVWTRVVSGQEAKLTIEASGTFNNTGIPVEAWFEDGLLYVREDSSYCDYDQIGVYEVHGVPGEKLIIKSISDDCGTVWRFIAGTWTNASPP